MPRPGRSPSTRRAGRSAGIERGARRSVTACRCLFPLREGDVIGVLHKTTDWLTGEAPFDKRSSEDAFFVVRESAHLRLARACAQAIRAKELDTESYSSDAAADVVLASFVEGEGGAAADAYALRWCLFHETVVPSVRPSLWRVARHTCGSG